MFISLSSYQSIELNGQFVGDDLINRIKSKKLHKNEIIRLIGTPTYVPDYSKNSWYYIHRSLKHEWFKPRTVTQRIVKIFFDKDEKLLYAFLLKNTNNEKIKIKKVIQKFLVNRKKSFLKTNYSSNIKH